jgi:3-methyladenine DNA glycosylase/8-oxoguanine DNA glycosylase
VDEGGAASTGGWSFEFALVGPGGEKVDLHRTLASHGGASLPPMRLDGRAPSLDTTLAVAGGRPRRVRVGAGSPGHGVVTVLGTRPGARARAGILAGVRHILRLDEDLSGFYALAASEPELAWVTEGAGRMLRSATVFEDVVKTVCTTNCAWSATERMVGALVEHLGEPARGAPSSGPYGRTFPAPAAMAKAGEGFYRDVVRAGYRGRYLRELAQLVAGGAVDLEELGRASPDEPSDEELAARLQAHPRRGPYAAAHIMMMLGRYSRLILDSWTRPTYARLTGGRPVKDRRIEWRFRRYGRYAGLAFWLFLTRDWV